MPPFVVTSTFVAFTCGSLSNAAFTRAVTVASSIAPALVLVARPADVLEAQAGSATSGSAARVRTRSLFVMQRNAATGMPDRSDEADRVEPGVDHQHFTG